MSRISHHDRARARRRAIASASRAMRFGRPTETLQALEPRLLLAAAELVVDVNRVGPGSDPAQTVVMDGIAYFIAGADRGLWRSDGTTAGTWKVKDGVNGSVDALSLYAANGKVLFATWDAPTGRDLWVSDGTTAGTTLLKDVSPGSAWSDPKEFTTIGAVTYFTAGDETGHRNLWRTDGTPGGTSRVKVIRPDAPYDDPGPHDLFAFKGKLYFIANNGTGGWEVWASDGTEAGTGQWLDLRAGSASAFANSLSPQFAAAGDTLLFRAYDNAESVQVYRSDGTVDGTRPLRGFGPEPTTGPFPVNVESIVAAGNTFYLTAGGTIWRSDGTHAGTFSLAPTIPRPASGTSSGWRPLPASLSPVGNVLYFVTAAGSYGEEVWRTDGTYGGTRMVADVNPGIGSAFPFQYNNPQVTSFAAGADGILYFSAYNDANGVELWRTDGTQGGTRLLEVNPGSGSSHPTAFAALGTKLVFAANDGKAGREPWITDGTPAGTRMLRDAEPATFGSDPLQFQNVGGTLMFTANDGTGHRGLYTSDASKDGTFLVSAVAPEVGNSTFYFSAAATKKLLFYAGTDAKGTELWRSDGTPQGTYRLSDILPGPGSSMPTYGPFAFAAVGDTCLFIANDGVHGAELWRADGKPGGTALVADICPGGGGSIWVEPNFTIVGNVLYFVADNGSGLALWRSDGTTAGTWKVTAAPTPEISAWGVFGGRLYFNAADANHGGELWATDGTVAGTGVVRDIVPGAGSSAPRNFVASGDDLYFNASTPAAGRELWRTDGTEGGTQLVRDITPGPTGSDPTELVDVRGTLYFNTSRPTAIWKTDGTAAGTIQVTPGGQAGMPSGMFFSRAVKDVLYFIADTPGGFRVWYTDGTTAGTKPLDGLQPMGALSLQVGLDLDGHGTLFFRYIHPVYGSEVWMVPTAKKPDKPKGLHDGSQAPGPAAAPPVGAPPPRIVSLTWEPGDDMNGYLVERSASADFASIDRSVRVPANFQEYTEPADFTGTRYYRLIAYNPAGASEPAVVTVTVDDVPPVVTAAEFHYQTGPLRLTVAFSEDVSASLVVGDARATGPGGAVAIPTDVSFDEATDVATFTFGPLADGDWRFDVAAPDVTDAAGNPLAADLRYEFFVFAGDADHDRTVDFDDLVALAQNYNTSGRTFAEGDFTGDGNVDFNDLVVLAQRYNTSLAPPPGAAAAPVSVGTEVTFAQGLGDCNRGKGFRRYSDAAGLGRHARQAGETKPALVQRPRTPAQATRSPAESVGKRPPSVVSKTAVIVIPHPTTFSVKKIAPVAKQQNELFA